MLEQTLALATALGLTFLLAKTFVLCLLSKLSLMRKSLSKNLQDLDFAIQMWLVLGEMKRRRQQGEL